MNNLHLGNNQPRRAGLNRSYKGPPLHAKVNSAQSQSQNTMPSKYTTRHTSSISKTPTKKNLFNGDKEEDINRKPDSDSSSEEDDNKNADMNTWDQVEARKKSQNDKRNGTMTVNEKPKSGPGKERSRRTNVSPGSSNSTNCQKRKAQEDLPKLGANMVDAHGRLNVQGNKRAKNVYGSQRSNGYGKNSSSQKRGTQDSPVTPKKKFIAPDPVSSSQKASSPDDLPKRFRVSSLDFETPTKEAEVKNEFKKPNFLSSSPRSTSPDPSISFKRPDMLSSPAHENEEKLQNNRVPAFGDEVPGSDLDSSFHCSIPIITRPVQKPNVEEEYPATQIPTFVNYLDDLSEDVRETARAGFGLNSTSLRHPSNVTSYVDTEATMVQAARCPLCNEPVDAADLRSYGHMNTREQGNFCRMHKTKAAKIEWTIKGYPEIDWKTFDSRISKQHSFIEKLINGSNSHYRKILEEKVNAGKDRNLRQTTSNLTPGYYGSRGLRAISENIMTKFTELFKIRMLQDPLMSARGLNPYVQLVLVPEVAVRLIKEDMGVKVDEARQILAESITVGELLNEELGDVVTKRVEDSGDENHEDDE